MTAGGNVRVIVWNTEWAASRSRAASWLAEQSPSTADLVVLTEARTTLTDTWGGHTIDAGPDWGYIPKHRNDRKVMLWSQHPWHEVRTFSTGALAGRLVIATTQLATQSVTVFGVCVPWSMAHVATGSQQAQPWSEHRSYLTQLAPLLQKARAHGLVLLTGDFNQTLPRTRAPEGAHNLLRQCIEGGRCVTEGFRGEVDLLDHMVWFPHDNTSPASDVRVLPASSGGRRVSDHDLVEWTDGIRHN